MGLTTNPQTVMACGTACDDMLVHTDTGMQLTRVEWTIIELTKHRGEWMLVDSWRREDVGSMSALAQGLRRRLGLNLTVRTVDNVMHAYARMP